MLAVALTFVVSNGIQVLHFALVSHQWCALHEQFEHGPSIPIVRSSAPSNTCPLTAVSVTDVDDGVHGLEAGCAIIGSQQHHVAVLRSEQLSFGVSPDEVRPAQLVDAVVYGAPRLSFAPKRSPPSVSS